MLVLDLTGCTSNVDVDSDGFDDLIGDTMLNIFGAALENGNLTLAEALRFARLQTPPYGTLE